MSGDSPPPYSAVVAVRPVALLENSDSTLPFSNSDQLSAEILALVSEEKTLNSRFKDIRDVATVNFEHQAVVLALCRKFETVIWELRNIAGVAFTAIKDFNEVVLDFLAEPDVTVQDRLKELANTSKLLQRERESAADYKALFDDLAKELEEFRREIHSESGALPLKRQRQNYSEGNGTGGTWSLWKSRPFFVAPRSEPLSGLSTVTVCFGAFSRTCKDYALLIERSAEDAVFRRSVCPQPKARETSPVAPNSEFERPGSPAEHTETPALPRIVDTLTHDLREFEGRVGILNTILSELAREQDIFVVYLKDGHSVTNQGYRSEINRLQRHLPCVCNALDAYSKGRGL